MRAFAIAAHSFSVTLAQKPVLTSMLQLCWLQGRVASVLPVQQDFKQARVRVCIPPLHGLEQELHFSHGPQSKNMVRERIQKA